MNLEIHNARQYPLNDKEIRAIAEIECNPEVGKWLTEFVESDVEKEYLSYKRLFKNLPKNDEAEILVAEHDGRVVGFLALWVLGAYMEHVASVGVSVHPDYWGKGITTQLIRNAIEIAKKKGFIRLEIETLADNKAMRRAAEKLGFQLEALRKCRIKKDGQFRDEVAYSLLL